MTQPLHCEYEADARLARRAARAAIGYRVRSPMAFAPFLLMLVLAVIFAVSGVFWLTVGILLVLAAFVGSLMLRIPKLASQLAARGMGEGDTIAADWTDDDFTVTTRAGRGVHPYSQVRDVRVRDGIALIRLRTGGFLIMLPEQVVPGDARRILDERRGGHR